MNKKPVHILKGINTLTQTELEKRLLNESIDSYFTNENQSNIELFFDLSQVRWVNLGAAFQLCLLIEKVKKNNYKVYIALPIIENTDTENKSTKITNEIRENLRKRRKEANNFLKIISFDKAILCGHIVDKPTVFISEDFQFSKEELNLEYFNKVFSSNNDTYTPLSDYHDFNYNYIFPLTWISEDVQNYNELSNQIESILKDDKRGMHHIDILSLRNVILSELLKNLREHAGDNTQFALFSLGLIKSSSISLKKSQNKTIVHSNEIENNFLDGIIKSKINSIIEIYFGDTGIGLCNDELLKEYDVFHKEQSLISNITSQKKLIEWSFDKWSTVKKEETVRGTKGLYRIHRIVNKYNGIVHIRSKNTNGGFQKGGKISSEWVFAKSKLYNHPGTFIQTKLCPQKEILKYNLVSNNISKSKKKWKSVTYSITLESANIDSFTEWFRKIYIEGDFDNLILIFHPNKNEEINLKVFFEDVFLKVSELRHPKGIILYTATSIGKDNLEGIVNSTNERIIKLNENSSHPESINPDFDEVYDPVLVIGEGKSIYWYGGNQNINKILDEMYRSETGTYPSKITELNNYKSLKIEEQNEILKYLQNESSFFKISKNEQILFDFTNILSLYQDILLDKIKTNQFSEKDKKICSPKLDISDKWIYFKNILDKNNSSGFALALHTILLNENKLLKNPDNTFLFIDHIQQYSLAIELARLIGIKDNRIINISEDIDLELPRRTKLFNEGDNVLVLTTVIASSETIRRLVKHIYRDKANVLAIVSLTNKRKGEKPNELITWNQPTNIYSIVNNKAVKEEKEQDYHKKNDGLIENLNSSLNNDLILFSPEYEISSNNEEFSYELNNELQSLFERTQSLHYNHFGKYNNRHYTFFLNKDKILKDRLIAIQIKEEINLWIDEQKIKENYTIVIPNTNNKSLRASIEIFDSNSDYDEIIDLDSFIKQKKKPSNVIFFDFGSLTGKTINKVISSNPAKKNLLIITVFSQFKGDEKDFYNKIKKIESEYIADKKDNEEQQPSLFPKENEIESEPVKTDINVKYKQLFDLPIYFYQSIHCPICQHIEALDSFKLKKSKYLKKFSEDRKLKIKIRDYNQISSIPSDPYVLNNRFEENEMSSTLISNMYMFKRLLEYSLIYTSSRKFLFKKLFSIKKNKEEQIKNSSSELYALIYLLSYEIIWLQKEPLIFRNFRYIIYSLSKFISNFDIDNLTNILNVNNNNNRKTGFNLATRYKYAAISVFRSSNKYYYCQNIKNILSSSIIDNRIGDNIVQNTLYHINSIHLNRHNNSDNYFKYIEEQLNAVLSSEIPLTEEQKEAIILIKFNNKKNRKEVELVNLSQLELFKKLKNEVLEIYNLETNHPWPKDHFLAIRIDDSSKILNNITEHREQSFSFGLYNDLKDALRENYDKVKSFIFINIIPYINAIDNLERNLLSSYSYNSFKGKFFRFLNIVDEFELLINQGSDNILYLIDEQSKYISFCDLINNTFIHRETINYNNSNAEIFNFLNSIPCKIKDTITTVFSKQGFNSLSININDDVNAFICKNSLNRYLKLILGNMKKRQNINFGKEEKYLITQLDKCDLQVKTEVVEDLIILSFNYSNTEFFNVFENETGDLYQFDKELRNFGGSLTHKLLDNGHYLINIKLLNYGN